MERAILDDAMACSVIGDKADIKSWLEEFLTVTKVDELMVDADSEKSITIKPIIRIN